MLSPVFSKIPPELTQRARWVVWRGAKVPYIATAPSLKASSIDPNTWATFEQAQATYEEGGFSGVGFALNGDGIVGVDIDNCVVEGLPVPAAMQLMAELECAYIEYSPSRTGLRGFGYGPRIKGVRGKRNSLDVELYATGRYLTVTGHAISSGPFLNLGQFVAVAEAIKQTPTEVIQKITEDHSSHLLSSSVGIPLHRFIPSQEGERNRCLFNLARYVKGRMPNAGKDALRPILMAWHQMAMNTIGTKDFATSWADFLRAMEGVKFPHGSTLDAMLAKVESAPPLSASLLALGYGEKCNYLIRVCQQLQAHAGTEPFFLSVRQAGEILDIHFTDAAKFLSALKGDGVIQLISQGAGNKASRFRFIWPE